MSPYFRLTLAIIGGVAGVVLIAAGTVWLITP